MFRVFISGPCSIGLVFEGETTYLSEQHGFELTRLYHKRAIMKPVTEQTCAELEGILNEFITKYGTHYRSCRKDVMLKPYGAENETKTVTYNGNGINGLRDGNGNGNDL